MKTFWAEKEGGKGITVGVWEIKFYYNIEKNITMLPYMYI